MVDRVNQLVSKIQARENEQSSLKLNGIPAAVFRVSFGSKFATVTRKSGSTELPYCRVDLRNGDLVDTKLTPDTRDDAVVGNIFAFDFDLKSLPLYGVPTVRTHLRPIYRNTADDVAGAGEVSEEPATEEPVTEEPAVDEPKVDEPAVNATDTPTDSDVKAGEPASSATSAPTEAVSIESSEDRLARRIALVERRLADF